jgi:acyl carrier protein
VTSEAVRAKIRAYVMSHFHVGSERELGDEESLLEARIIDSLGILELVGFLEKTFAIEVADDDLSPENFDSIGALTRYVAKRSGQRS